MSNWHINGANDVDDNQGTQVNKKKKKYGDLIESGLNFNSLGVRNKLFSKL